MCMDILYAQIAVYKPNTKQEETNMIYGQARGIRNPEWIDIEECRTKRISD